MKDAVGCSKILPRVKGFICLLLTHFPLLGKFTSFLKAYKTGKLFESVQQTLCCWNVICYFGFFIRIMFGNVDVIHHTQPGLSQFKLMYFFNSSTGNTVSYVIRPQALVILLSGYFLKNVTCKKTL